MSKAPEFNLQDQAGNTHKLSDYLGKWVALYFYPKDNTPGCTKEACSFRDNYKKLAQIGVVILGVSKDTVESHKKFSEKHKLNFPILSDSSKEVIKAYGAWGKKKFLGKEYEGTTRMTYLIDPVGKIKKIYEKVNPLVHAGEIVEDLNVLRAKRS